MEAHHSQPSSVRPAFQRRTHLVRCRLFASLLLAPVSWASHPPAADDHGADDTVHAATASEAVSASRHSPSTPPLSTADDWVIPDATSAVDPVSAGTPTFAHFFPDLFGGAHNFGGVAQTRDGRLYVVAEHRVLVGTGAHWQPLPGVPPGPVGQLYLARDERLYLSLKDDYGFLRPQSPERPGWQSIADLLPAEWRAGIAWKPLFEDAEGYVYFASGPHVFAHHPEKAMRLWRNVGGVVDVFSLHGDVHVMTDHRAIYRLEAQGKVEPVLRDISPNYADIRASVPFDADRQLFAAGAAGLITFDGKHFAPFRLKGLEGSPLVPDQLLRLQDDLFLALDYTHGLIVFRGDGTVLRQVHQFGDLKARIAQAATIDTEGWIWVAHTSGLYRINPLSPQTTFDYHQGLEGRVLCMTEHDGQFYVGTDDGLFVWETRGATKPGHFLPISNVPAARSLVSTAQGLAVGTDRGLWVVDGRGPHLVESNRFPLLLKSPSAPDVLLAPTERGIRSFVHNGFRWVPDPRAAKLPTSGLEIAIGPDGDLWGEYGPGRLAHYAFGPAESAPTIFSPQEGLPLSTIAPFRLGDDMLFSGANSLLRYSPQRHVFMRSEGWQPQEHANGRVPTAAALVAPDQTLWVPTSALGHDYIAFPPRHFDYAWQDMLRFGEDPITAVYTDSIGYLWVGNGRGLQRFRPRTNPPEQPPTRPTLVHRISGDGTPLAASAAGVAAVELGALAAAPRLLRVEYSLLDFRHPGGASYATFLEGFDRDWQPFTPETARSVTALPPGPYTLHIKARDHHGKTGTPATVSFSIPQSATQTWWARTLYGLGGLGAIAFLVYLKQRKQHAEAKSLRTALKEKDTLITEHEAELKTRQSQLKSAVNRADELSEHTDQLVQNRARFEADLDHALRPALASLTHLGGLLGQESLNETAARLLEGLRKTAEQLVGSVREHLDLRQVETDHLPLDDAPFNLREPIENALAALAPAARARHIELIYTFDREMSPHRTGDARRLEQILSHLLANAIAHAEEGDVVVEVGTKDAGAPDELTFNVVNRGQSLSDEERATLLQQSDPKNTPRYRGAPQGLSAARHLLDALGGEFDFDNHPEGGTQAKIELRLPADPAPQISPPPAFDEKCVLIVDDHPQALDSLQLLAEQHGLATRLANDGPQALATLQEAAPIHLVWIDAHLGETPGHEVLAQLRSEPAGADLPAVVLVPFALGPELQALAEDPRTLLLGKPAGHSHLITASAALLRDGDGAAAPSEPVPSPSVAEEVEDDEEEEEDEMDAKIRAALAKANAKAASDGSSRKTDAPSPTEPASPLKILLVDSHPVRPHGTLALLQQFGYQAQISQTLDDATAAIEESDRDLVLLTEPLGHTLADAVSQLKKAVHGEESPVFAAIAATVDEDARKAGLHEHLRAPLDAVALRRLLRMVTPSEARIALST